MRASKVLLRWYRSFNNRYHGYQEANGQGRQPWETFRGQHFPFVEIPLDRRVTTIVGANESGKSHLLSAIAKVLTGVGIGDDIDKKYAIQDICRYCAFEGLDEDVWPSIGIELTFDSGQEYTQFWASIGHPQSSSDSPTSTASNRLTVVLDGTHGVENFATLYTSDSNSPATIISKAKWEQACEGRMPALKFIDAKVALANEVHVKQLLKMYAGEQPTTVYDPLKMQGIIESFLSIRLVPNAPLDPGVASQHADLCASIEGMKLGLKTGGMLEVLLFRDVLGIRQETLERMVSLGGTNRGYVERLVSEINHRLDESLDLSHFWQQDDEFKLTVDYKTGFFYFEITDKTGAKYTFNERSSGLRYFLSYYIQAKAIEKANEKRGSIVLMDEPDSFLSIAGQRNLLQVFDSLVSPKASSGSCQIVYTTHSPFLINRNFPQRLCLVRKGDGSEGTQYVPRSGIRRYEPVRSALGVDCAETLFMGATNIVVEGVSDQKVLIAAIQRFGARGDVDQFLNLNRITFVTAGGASHVPKLVQKSISGDEKRPIVIVLLDGDAAGSLAHQELTGKGVLEKEFVTTIDQVGLLVSWTASPTVFEDMIPPSLLAVAASQYLREHWDEQVAYGRITDELMSSASKGTMADRIVASVRRQIASQADGYRDEEIKGQILDILAERLVDGSELDGHESLSQFEENIRLLCEKLRAMIDEAERRSIRDSLHKGVRLSVTGFVKSHHRGATRTDMERCLTRLERECSGLTSEAKVARENLSDLREILMTERANARDLVDMDAWKGRLELFKQCPWKAPAGGW